MKRIGERTQWGIVSAIALLNGERYYWFVSDRTDSLTMGVSMLPAVVVEA